MGEARIHPYTVLAAAIMLALTVPFALAAWSMWQVSAGPIDPVTYEKLAVAGIDGGFAEVFGRALTRDDARFWIRLSGAWLGLLCAFSAWLAVGVALRREWARHTGFVMFLLFALIALPLAFGGAFATPRPSGFGGAVFAAMGTCGVLGLLATRQVADDIARGTFYRLRRRRRPPGPSGAGPGWRDDRGEPPILAA